MGPDSQELRRIILDTLRASKGPITIWRIDAVLSRDHDAPYRLEEAVGILREMEREGLVSCMRSADSFSLWSVTDRGRERP